MSDAKKPKPLIVWGYGLNGRNRRIVAGPSFAACVRAERATHRYEVRGLARHMKTYGCNTGNAQEVSIAAAKPGVVFESEERFGFDPSYREVSPYNAAQPQRREEMAMSRIPVGVAGVDFLEVTQLGGVRWHWRIVGHDKSEKWSSEPHGFDNELQATRAAIPVLAKRVSVAGQR